VSILATWTRGSHTADGITHPTYRKGSGPGVVIIHEIPGMTSEVITFAEEVVESGHTVVMPHLFGEADGPASMAQVAQVLPRLCVSKEFTKLALHETAPIADWLRSLARELHAELGGPGVGALGMCFTGGSPSR
jgi:dienelactone hydrolase